MYSRCVADNPFCEGCSKVCFDNSEENVPIGVRYNSFLENCTEDCWIVFCHEDWQVKQDLAELVGSLNPDYIYGPIGAFLKTGRRSDFVIYKGSIREGTKDGRIVRKIANRVPAGRVDTLDCQCVIVHSSLIRRTGLRFDAKLRFDMYVEDFCASAFTCFGVQTMVIPIKCVHYSPGVISSGFEESLKYVREKFAGAPKRFATIVGYKTVFGGDASKPVHRAVFPLIGTLLGA